MRSRQYHLREEMDQQAPIGLVLHLDPSPDGDGTDPFRDRVSTIRVSGWIGKRLIVSKASSIHLLTEMVLTRSGGAGLNLSIPLGV